MSNFITQHKKILMVGGAALLLALGFYFFSVLDTSSVSGVSLSGPTQEQLAVSESIERELIAELARLRTIELNPALFATPAFQSLIDFSREIPEQPRGRANPFAPIGG